MNIFREDFIDNRNSWRLGQDVDKEFSIDDGVAIFEYRKNTGFWAFWIPVDFISKQDFDVFSALNCISCGNDSWYGLIWGIDDINADYFAFSLSADGTYYRVDNVINGTSNNLIPKSKLPYPININSPHSLGIKKSGMNWGVFVNEKKIGGFISNDNLFGRQFGFIAGPQTKICIYNLIVRSGFSLLEKRPSQATIPGHHQQIYNTKFHNDYFEDIPKAKTEDLRYTTKPSTPTQSIKSIWEEEQEYLDRLWAELESEMMEEGWETYCELADPFDEGIDIFEY